MLDGCVISRQLPFKAIVNLGYFNWSDLTVVVLCLGQNSGLPDQVSTSQSVPWLSFVWVVGQALTQHSSSSLYVCMFVRSFVRSIDRSFDRSFVCSFVCLFVCKCFRCGE